MPLVQPFSALQGIELSEPGRSHEDSCLFFLGKKWRMLAHCFILDWDAILLGRIHIKQILVCFMEHFQIFFVVRCILKHSRFMKTSSLLYLGVLERLYLQFQLGQVQLWKDTFFLAKRLLPMLEWLFYISWHRGGSNSDSEKSWQFNSKMQRHWHVSKSNNNCYSRPAYSKSIHTPIMIRYGNKKSQTSRCWKSTRFNIPWKVTSNLQWICGARFVHITNCQWKQSNIVPTDRPTTRPRTSKASWMIGSAFSTWKRDATNGNFILLETNMAPENPWEDEDSLLGAIKHGAYFQGVFFWGGFSGCVGFMASKKLGP